MYRCLYCESKNGEAHVDKHGQPNGTEDWYWLMEQGLRYGPFCSRACSAKFKQMTPYDRFHLIFKDGELAEKMLQLKKKALHSDELGTLKIRWTELPTCIFPKKLDDDSEFGQVRGVSPMWHTRHRLTLEPGYEAVYGEMG